jgi:uncharacterized protein
MLISFSVENFLSFDKEVTFSMIANGRESQHGDRLVELKSNNKKVLPIAVIYGGNASGKSNFVKAIEFAVNYVKNGITKDESIKNQPYKLNPLNSEKPSKFIFQFLIDSQIYEYGFKVTSKAVQHEWLIRLGKTSEQVIYERELNKFSRTNAKLGKIKEFLYFLSDITYPNNLFLSNIINKNIEKHEELSIIYKVYEWFELITIIKPTSFFRIENFVSNRKLLEFVDNKLHKLDTGISSYYVIPEKEESASIHSASKNDKIIPTSFKVFTHHIDKSKNFVEFSIDEESDGTIRLTHLLPAFFILANSEKNQVIIIDEFDRSLHPLLTRTLLSSYLKSCSEKKGMQLLITTHDVMLLDQELLRRDEIWFVEKNIEGASELTSLSDFKNVRKDKKILNDYLVGRYDGIPNFMFPSNSLFSDAPVKGNKE